MKRWKNLQDQVVVITGASSGIGLTTARAAARRGARLVLAARNEEALRELTEEIRAQGGDAVYVKADVASQDDVREISRVALERYGTFDTWINNAGAAIYGRMDRIPAEDHRRLFETNFWGVVNGSLEAAKHLRNRGGAIINIGSVLSDRAIPMQGMYSASKHAVKGFTDALRMELEDEGAPVSVTLIKPSGIDTPYTQHAKNYMEEEPSLPPPVYAPDAVAEAILECAESPKRDVFVGFGGKLTSAMGQYAPRLTDKMMEAFYIRQQKSGRPPRDRNSLHAPSFGMEERGDYEGHVAKSALYTKASLHPFITGSLAIGAGLLTVAVVRQARNGRGRWRDRLRQRVPFKLPEQAKSRLRQLTPSRLRQLTPSRLRQHVRFKKEAPHRGLWR